MTDDYIAGILQSPVYTIPYFGIWHNMLTGSFQTSGNIKLACIDLQAYIIAYFFKHGIITI